MTWNWGKTGGGAPTAPVTPEGMKSYVAAVVNNRMNLSAEPIKRSPNGSTGIYTNLTPIEAKDKKTPMQLS